MSIEEGDQFSSESPGSVPEEPAEPVESVEPAEHKEPAPTETEPPHSSDIVGEHPAEPSPKKSGSFWKELPLLILIAFGLALLIKTFLIQAFFIPSESMVPTLEVNDRVLVNKVVYHIHPPRRGDIVVFVGERVTTPRSFWQKIVDGLTSGLGRPTSREKDFIKRVIGLPGETLQISNSIVTITPANGGRSFTLKEPYAVNDPTPFGPVVVPKGSYFVLGDNRPNSSDSRYSLGPIKGSEIVGRAFVRIWPFGRFAFLTRPDYGASIGITLIIGLWRKRRRRKHARLRVRNLIA
ncbi:MAG: signal peptidase I [Actinomycetota bacterium]